MALMPHTIELSIAEVVLEGTRGSERFAVADALQAELARLFTEQPPAFDTPTGAERMPAAAMPVSMQAPAEALGTAIAASVHSGWRS
jgi:hypothetical protein